MKILKAQIMDQGREITLVYNSQKSVYRDMYDKFVDSVPTGKEYTRLDIMIDLANGKRWKLEYLPPYRDIQVDNFTETDVLGDIGDK